MDQSDQFDPSFIIFIYARSESLQYMDCVSVDMDGGEVMIGDTFMLENEIKLKCWVCVLFLFVNYMIRMLYCCFSLLHLYIISNSC